MNVSKTKRMAMIAVAAIFIASAVQAQQMQIAVLDFRAGAGVEQGDVDGVSAIFGTYFHNPQKFRLVERTQIDRVVREQGFQHSTLTNQQMVRIGQILNIQKMVIGDINIVGGQHNVDVRVVDVQTGSVEATEGAMWARGSSYRELMRGLATRLMAKIQVPTTVASASASTTTQTPTPTPATAAVVTLFDHLHVFPEDIGEFHDAPTNVIATINRNAMHGYNNWRLPTSEELALMRANASRLGLRSGVDYMTSDGWTRSGVVRLVTTGRTVVQQDAERRTGVRIAGVNWAIGNLGPSGFVSPSELGYYFPLASIFYEHCPPGWRLPTQAEFEALVRTGSTWVFANSGRGNQTAGRFFGPNHANCSLPDNMAGCIFLPASGANCSLLTPSRLRDFGQYLSSTYGQERGRDFIQSLFFNENESRANERITLQSEHTIRCVR